MGRLSPQTTPVFVAEDVSVVLDSYLGYRTCGPVVDGRCSRVSLVVHLYRSSVGVICILQQFSEHRVLALMKALDGQRSPVQLDGVEVFWQIWRA